MAQPVSFDSSDRQHDACWTGRVFLVQLSLDACPASGQYCGRVQHLRSNDAAHFESLEELAHFMRIRVGDSVAGDVSLADGGVAPRT
jgi:hypothetical protein